MTTQLATMTQMVAETHHALRETKAALEAMRSRKDAAYFSGDALGFLALLDEERVLRAKREALEVRKGDLAQALGVAQFAAKRATRPPLGQETAYATTDTL